MFNQSTVAMESIVQPSTIIQIPLITCPLPLPSKPPAKWKRFQQFCRQLLSRSNATLILAFGELQIMHHQQIRYRAQINDLQIKLNEERKHHFLQITGKHFPNTILTYQSRLSYWQSNSSQADYRLATEADWLLLLQYLALH